MKEYICVCVFLICSLLISHVRSECDGNSGFYSWGSHCYMFSEGHWYNLRESREQCGYYESQLVNVDSAEENRFIANNLPLFGAGPERQNAGVYTNHGVERYSNERYIVTNAVYSNVTSWHGISTYDQVVIDYKGRWNFYSYNMRLNFLCKKRNPDFDPPAGEKLGRACIVKKSGRVKPYTVKHESYLATEKALYYCGNGVMASSKVGRLT